MARVRRTERASLSAIGRFLKSPAASFVRKQKNSARSSRILRLVGLLRKRELPLLPDAFVAGITTALSFAAEASTRKYDMPLDGILDARPSAIRFAYQH